MNQKKIVSRNVEWKIKNFTKEALVEGSNVFSDEFEIPVADKYTKWWLEAIIRDSNIKICLLKNPEIAEFLTRLEISIRAFNKKEMHYYFEKSCIEFLGPWSSFVSIADLFNNSDKYLKNGILTIGAKIDLIKLEKSDDNTCTDFRHSLIFKDYFVTKSYSDLTFVCSDGIEIKAHRFVLGAVSPVFKKMFDTESCYIIKIDDIDGKTMTEILRYMYTVNVHNIENHVSKLLYGADKYGLHDLKDLCAKSIIKNLSITNAVDYFLLADQYDIKDLLNHCIKFTRTYQNVLMTNQDNWNKLEKKHLNMLLVDYQKNVDYVQVLESSL